MSERFEEWQEEKRYLIEGAMKQLQIEEMEANEFYEIGLVALWEASIRYEKDSTDFDMIAYICIVNRMKDVRADRLGNVAEKFKWFLKAFAQVVRQKKSRVEKMLRPVDLNMSAVKYRVLVMKNEFRGEKGFYGSW
ncbi:hypothetical protein [Turicibacter sanguinis]|uniref:hypothetical protein n=1 Tax=Turicibacter sanguinis TaxID=154288 RepID=UPI0018AC2189|nr:hypothetical protein [Turicibacter sanguinis]MDB8559592.1 hypothetical protein [Turicibacter sanguinis]MDB8561045.1 hypothetical protein [Turicibacter sanguinis]